MTDQDSGCGRLKSQNCSILLNTVISMLNSMGHELVQIWYGGADLDVNRRYFWAHKFVNPHKSGQNWSCGAKNIIKSYATPTCFIKLTIVHSVLYIKTKYYSSNSRLVGWMLCFDFSLNCDLISATSLLTLFLRAEHYETGCVKDCLEERHFNGQLPIYNDLS